MVLRKVTRNQIRVKETILVSVPYDCVRPRRVFIVHGKYSRSEETDCKLKLSSIGNEYRHSSQDMMLEDLRVRLRCFCYLNYMRYSKPIIRCCQ